jgi:hypothetical protein
VFALSQTIINNAIQVKTLKMDKAYSFLLQESYQHFVIPKPDITKTFGINKDGLRQLYFNVVNTSYRAYIQGNVSSVDGLGGNSPSIIGPLNQASARTNMFFTSTSNKRYLFYNVAKYYSESLQAEYGNIETKFIKFIGIGAARNISYNTIMFNANNVLSQLVQTKNNYKRFAFLFKGNVNSVYFIKHHFNYSGTAPEWLNDYENISLNSPNFYSLTEHLFQNTYSQSGSLKRISEKLLVDLALNHMSNFIKTFKSIRKPKHQESTILQKAIIRFLYYFKNSRIKAMLSTIKSNFRFKDFPVWKYKITVTKRDYHQENINNSYYTTSYSEKICPAGYPVHGNARCYVNSNHFKIQLLEINQAAMILYQYLYLKLLLKKISSYKYNSTNYPWITDRIIELHYLDVKKALLKLNLPPCRTGFEWNGKFCEITTGVSK